MPCHIGCASFDGLLVRLRAAYVFRSKSQMSVAMPPALSDPIKSGLDRRHAGASPNANPDRSDITTVNASAAASSLTVSRRGMPPGLAATKTRRAALENL